MASGFFTPKGIDRDDEERVLELTQQLFASDDPDIQREGASRTEASKELGTEFYVLFDRIINDRRAHPRDDLASLLANAMLPGGEALGPLETFGYYLIVFSAGHDTTRNALSGPWRRSSSIPTSSLSSGRTQSSRVPRSRRSCAGRRPSTT